MTAKIVRKRFAYYRYSLLKRYRDYSWAAHLRIYFRDTAFTIWFSEVLTLIAATLTFLIGKAFKQNIVSALFGGISLYFLIKKLIDKGVIKNLK